VKAISALITVAVAIALQMLLARYAVGGRWTFDLVLVGVLYAALQSGPTAGILAGTVGGLAQDALSGGTIGVDGLAKTIVGFAAGIVGGQFVVNKTGPRLVLTAGATVVHRSLLWCLQALIDQRWSGVSWFAMLSEIVLNSLAAFLAFQMIETLPGAMARRRSGRRSGLARRDW
jgi:rod shape-determining protein MreD